MKWENTYTASTHDHQCDGRFEVFVVNLIEVLNYHFEFTMYTMDELATHCGKEHEKRTKNSIKPYKMK